MKNLLIIIILGLLFSSCMTISRVSKNCDLFMAVCEVPIKKEVEIITNTVTEIQYKDTTIYIEIPGKEVIKEIPVYIEKGLVNSGLSVLNVPFAESYSQVVNSKLRHELIQTDTLLLFKLENSLQTIKTQEKQIKVLKEKYVVTVKENTAWAKFCIKVFWGLSITVFLGVVFLIIRFKSKIVGLFK